MYISYDCYISMSPFAHDTAESENTKNDIYAENSR